MPDISNNSSTTRQAEKVPSQSPAAGQSQSTDLSALTVTADLLNKDPEHRTPHTASSVISRWGERGFPNTGTTMEVQAQTNNSSNKAEVCVVTLTGPTNYDSPSFPLSLLPWTQPAWQRVEVTMQIGSEQFPNWDHANKCITAIQDMLTMCDGLVSGDLVQALTQNIEKVSVSSFRGRPAD